MSTVTIVPGTLVTKDPDESKVYLFDWDTSNLAALVTIVTSTFVITALKPATDTALTKDNAAINAGSRTTQVRLLGGTIGARYEIENTIVTNETPAQTKVRSFQLLIEPL